MQVFGSSQRLQTLRNIFSFLPCTIIVVDHHYARSAYEALRRAKLYDFHLLVDQAGHHFDNKGNYYFQQHCPHNQTLTLPQLAEQFKHYPQAGYITDVSKAPNLDKHTLIIPFTSLLDQHYQHKFYQWNQETQTFF